MYVCVLSGNNNNNNNNNDDDDDDDSNDSNNKEEILSIINVFIDISSTTLKYINNFQIGAIKN